MALSTGANGRPISSRKGAVVESHMTITGIKCSFSILYRQLPVGVVVKVVEKRSRAAMRHEAKFIMAPVRLERVLLPSKARQGRNRIL